MGSSDPISEINEAVFEKYVKQEEEKAAKFIATAEAASAAGSDDPMTGNPYDIHRRLGEIMTDEMTVVRTQEGMQKALGVARDLIKEYEGVKLGDNGAWTNQNLSFTRALGDMLIYAEAMLLAGIERKESRGCHYCSDQDGRNDEKYQKSAVTQYDPTTKTHKVVWEDVPIPLVEPRIRDYGGKKKRKKAAAKA